MPIALAADKPKIVASFSIIGDMVREIAGDKVDLAILVGADGDAHEYQANAADAKKIAGADVVFINGLGFEGWLERLVKSSSFHGKIVTVSDGVKVLAGKNGQNPHAWQSLASGKVYAENIAKALAEIDHANAKTYQQNAKKYSQKLDRLDAWAKAEIAKIPAEKRRVLTTHDAFGYFARDYGVEFIALQGISTESQPTAAELARAIKQAREQKISALFLENMTDSRLMKQIEKDTGIRIGGVLYADALSASGGDASSYTAMFSHNVNEIVHALQ